MSVRRPAAGWGLAAAWGMFTVLPAPVLASVDRDTARRAMLALPWVGLGLGALAGAASGAVLLLGGGGTLAAVAGVAVLAATTGALHLDGLADTADGLGSRRAAPEALEIMKRSDIGPMGVVSLVLVLASQVAALASVPEAALPWVVAATAMVGRIPALGATRAGVPPARPGGFGALFAGVTSRRGLGVDAAAVLTVATALGWAAGGVTGAATLAAAAGVAWGIAFVWQRTLERRLGGITGDTLGSLIEVTQAAFAVSCALLPF